MKLPTFIKFLHNDMWIKIEANLLLENNEDCGSSPGCQQFSLRNLEEQVKNCLGPSYTLDATGRYFYTDKEGDRVLINTSEALKIALEDCQEESLKVYVEGAKNEVVNRRSSLGPQVQKSPGAAKQQVKDLERQVSALTEHIKRLQKLCNEQRDEISGLKKEMLELSLELHEEETVNEEKHDRPTILNIPSPTRIMLTPGSAFLLGNRCFFLDKKYPSRPCISFQNSTNTESRQVALWETGGVLSGTFRAVIEVANCQKWVPCHFGVVGGKNDNSNGKDPEQVQRQAQSNIDVYSKLEMLQLPPTHTLPSYCTKGVTQNGTGVATDPFQLTGVIGEKFVLATTTASVYSFDVLSVTLESVTA